MRAFLLNADPPFPWQYLTLVQETRGCAVPASPLPQDVVPTACLHWPADGEALAASGFTVWASVLCGASPVSLSPDPRILEGLSLALPCVCTTRTWILATSQTAGIFLPGHGGLCTTDPFAPWPRTVALLPALQTLSESLHCGQKDVSEFQVGRGPSVLKPPQRAPPTRAEAAVPCMARGGPRLLPRLLSLSRASFPT